MKNLILLLAAFAYAGPALADSSEVPANFGEAIVRESADDQGALMRRPNKQKPAKKQHDAGFPEGFEKAILSESGRDQHAEPKSTKKEPKARAKNKMPAEDMIAKIIRHNELYGDEDGPSTEEECITEYSSQVEISACREMLGLKKSVVSSRQVATKKAPSPQGSSDHDKPSMDFVTD